MTFTEAEIRATLEVLYQSLAGGIEEMGQLLGIDTRKAVYTWRTLQRVRHKLEAELPRDIQAFLDEATLGRRRSCPRPGGSR